MTNKMRTFGVTLVAGLAFAGMALAADPVEGIWQTAVDDGAYAHITIEPCANAYCGSISKSFREDGSAFESENLGKQIVIGMVPQGDGTYEGQVFRPSNGKTYFGSITLNGDELKLSGCVAGGLICSRQNWTRVK